MEEGGPSRGLGVSADGGGSEGRTVVSKRSRSKIRGRYIVQDEISQ